MRAILERIGVTASGADLADCDLVIEAVFEDPVVKGEVTREAEQFLPPAAVFGSNTSTLPITELALASRRPTEFLGIHFFSPVHKMPLVEIIRGKATSERALAKAFDFVLQIGKTPIVVNDARGFYTSRVFGTYISEGMNLLAEGQHPRAIESAGLQAGMAVGPLAVSDEVNLELIWHIREQARQYLNGEVPASPSDIVLDFMVNKVRRTGKAQGAGFYEYGHDGKELWRGLLTRFANTSRELSQQEMIERLLFIQSLESIRCFQEGIVTTAADANIGSILGWSFPAYTGGTLQFVNAYGPGKFIARARELAQQYGERFEPPDLLVEMAARDERF
jgi:3-hydroxyacyl-CoA dehydrogenase/enoyl-CoA hydratase/3-hydroxybutyryl-CoA epimerase